MLSARKAMQRILATRMSSAEFSPTTPSRAFAVALGLIALITPLAVHLFFPVIPAVKVALGLSDAHAQFTFSIALFGMAFATLFYGSLSDRYGRRPMLLSGLSLFLIGSVVSAIGGDGKRASAGTAGSGDRCRLRADIGACDCAGCLSGRATRQGDRISDHVRDFGPDGVAIHWRTADRHFRLAQCVRFRARGWSGNYTHRLFRDGRDSHRPLTAARATRV